MILHEYIVLISSQEGSLWNMKKGKIRSPLLADSCIRHLILDMKQMHFMDSSGIGVILGRYRTLSQRGGMVSVKNMNPQVKRIFILSGMQQVIRMM